MLRAATGRDRLRRLEWTPVSARHREPQTTCYTNKTGEVTPLGLESRASTRFHFLEDNPCTVP